MLYKFNILFLLSYLNYKIMSISDHVYFKHFEFIFVAFTTLISTFFDKIITTDSPKSHRALIL